MCTELCTVIGAARAAASINKSVNAAGSLSSSLSLSTVGQTELSPSTSSLATASSTLSTVVSKPTTSFPSKPDKPDSHVAQKNIAIGVAVAVVVIASILFGLWAWWKFHRLGRSTVVDKRFATPSDDIQPYLQQKAELEDEARRRHELEAPERRYEKDGNEIYELPERHSRQEIPEGNNEGSLKN